VPTDDPGRDMYAQQRGEKFPEILFFFGGLLLTLPGLSFLYYLGIVNVSL
jgi:hypothetical protein